MPPHITGAASEVGERRIVRLVMVERRGEVWLVEQNEPVLGTFGHANGDPRGSETPLAMATDERVRYRERRRPASSVSAALGARKCTAVIAA